MDDFEEALIQALTEPVLEEITHHYGCVFLVRSTEEFGNAGILQIPDHF